MKRILLHYGIHKTGTTYLQNYIFPQIKNSDKWVYNLKLYFYLMDYLVNEDEKLNTKYFNKCQEYINEINKSHPKKNIFISFEGISGDLFRAYENQKEVLEKVFKLFPKAEVLLFFRYQTDWLLSCYKESINEYHTQNIEDFLNYKNDKFETDSSRINSNGFQNLNALSLNFPETINLFKQLYREKKDMRKKLNKHYKKLTKEILLKHPNIKLPSKYYNND
tara:strand:+ start:28649 stop:29311 length:663 start_codon:yes stop_codon:yes gene_type:complete